jgi:hypothetical protein
METLNGYRRIIRELIRHYAQFEPARGGVGTEIIFDESNDHYELTPNGRNGVCHIHGGILHIEIRNGKVWIQHGGAEDGVASQQVAAGIPREHIVLAFKPPEARLLTDYAVA